MPARVFATRAFSRFAKASRISDEDLMLAITRAEAGLIDADLGGGIIKQRIARRGAGRSSGHRTLIAFRSEVRAVFVFGFSKNDRDNVSARELSALRVFAADLLLSDEAALKRALEDGSLIEIESHE